jgi:C4-dicarboxylate transporter DctM subunit
MVISFFIAKKSGYKSTETFSIMSVFKTFYQAIFALLMPLIVLGGIYGGIFTPTEASVVAVVYALVVGLYIYKELTWSDIPRILFGSAKTSGSIMFLVSTASFFGWIMARERIPQMIAEIMLSISNDTVVILLMINILLLVVGCFVESLATIVILTPILFPLITNLGVDPLHFGIILCINVAVGTLTPPFGVCLFVASGITGIPLEKIAFKAMPFMIALILCVLILTYLPAITLFLPKLLAGN